MRELFSLFFLLCLYKVFGQVVINEIFPAPTQPKSEWIEIYNSSESEIFLDGLILTNRNYSTKIEKPIFISPNSFLVILHDTIGFSDFLSCKYLVAKFPTLHNDWDVFTIRKMDSTVIDSIYYDFKWGQKNFSLERYDWSVPAVSKDNWNISNGIAGHTLCQMNSKHIDEISIEDKSNFYKGNFSLVLKNIGRKEINNIFINFNLLLHINSQDSILPVFFRSIEHLLRNDSIHFTFRLDSIIFSLDYDLLKGIEYQIIFDSLGVKVLRVRNITLNLPKPFKSILLNEILFDAYSGCSEFLELVNISNENVSLSNWKIINSSGKAIIIPEDTLLKLHSGQYLALIWDSTFFNCFEEKIGEKNVYSIKSSFSLRNSGDQIYVLDPIGLVQDSINYSPEWHKGKITNVKQRSLEKMIESVASYDSSNWYTCVDERGATPGEINSVSIQKDESIWIDIEPNPFIPQKVERGICKIHFRLPFVQSRLNMKIFDLDGVQICDILTNELSPSSGTVEWDGKIGNQGFIKVGGYLLVLEAIDIQTGKVLKKIRTLAIGW